MDKKILFTEKLLHILAGKVSFSLEPTERRKLLSTALQELKNDPLYQDYYLATYQGNEDVFARDFFSYDIIDTFLTDPYVEDVMVNGLEPIYVHHQEEGLKNTEKRFSSRAEIEMLISKLITFSGRHREDKINNVELLDKKGRANIIYSPSGVYITITRAREQVLSIVDLIQKGTLNYEMAALLWLYVDGLRVRAANIVISGGPGTGKTTLLNALLGFMPQKERLVIIEDTFELNTDFLDNCVRLESDGELTMEDLVKNSLRMRPDRILIGEVRGRETKDMMVTLTLGKYGMATIHGMTARETIKRMQSEPMNVPVALFDLLDAIIIMKRYIHENYIFRVVDELSEVGGVQDKTVLLSQLWLYNHLKGQFIASEVASVYRDKLSQIQRCSPRRIIEELEIRANLLKLFNERGIHDIRQIYRLSNLYYYCPQELYRELGIRRQDLLANNENNNKT